MQVDFDTINILLAVSAIFVVSLGLFVYTRDKRNVINKSFFFFTISVCLWSVCKVLSRSVVDPLYFDLVFGMLYAVAASTPVFFLYFSGALIRLNTKMYERVRIGVLVAFASIVIISLVPDILIHAIQASKLQEPVITFNNLYALWYTLFLTSVYAGAYFLIFREYKKSKPEKKAQLSYILFGTSIPPILGTVANLVLPIFGIFSLSWLGQISIAIAVSIVVYGMMRHHVFDTRVIWTEISVLILWIIMFSQIVTGESVHAVLISTATFVAAVVVGLSLVKSMEREIETHDQLEMLTEKLKSSNDRLRELDQLKTEFLSIATHQLRTPLTAIKGYVSLVLEGDYGEVPQKMQKVFENIFRSSSLMAETITDFLNVSRIELGHMEYTKEDFNCCQLVSSVVDELQPRARDAGLQLNLNMHCNDSNAPIINGDYGKVKYIFSNLIENAIKYTLEGSVTVSLQVNKHSKRVLIGIKDTGIGIAKDEIDELFLKFKRARNARNINIKGSGLGLFVAREVADVHGGRIWVESEGEGKGSEFFVELPYIRIENMRK